MLLVLDEIIGITGNPIIGKLRGIVFDRIILLIGEIELNEGILFVELVVKIVD
jgi:hypothetical protein